MPAEGLARSWCGRESSLCALVCVGVLSPRPRARASSSRHGLRHCGCSQTGLRIWGCVHGVQGGSPGMPSISPALGMISCLRQATCSPERLPVGRAVSTRRGGPSPQGQACAGSRVRTSVARPCLLLSRSVPPSGSVCPPGPSPTAIPALLSARTQPGRRPKYLEGPLSPTNVGEAFRVLGWGPPWGANLGSQFAGGGSFGS